MVCQVLHATVAKQNALVEALESVQESSRVRVCILEQFATGCSEVNYILLLGMIKLNSYPSFVQKRMFCS